MRGEEGIILVGILIGLAIFITIMVFYLKNLSDLLKQISPSNRQVEPNNVWLMFIPFFNLVYPFILYPKVCDSTKAEYMSRGLTSEGDFSKGIGITIPILGLVSMIPVIGGIASLGNLILFIVFWVKTAGYKNKLMMSPAEEGTVSSSPDLLD